MSESERALKALILESGIEAYPTISAQLQSYLALLTRWNSRINLTSSADWGVLGPLFQEGIWASTLYPDHATRHLDIGSGAGFPAILLKIMKPGIRLDLVESRAKKGVFLETTAHSLGLGEVRVHSMPLQAFLRKCDPKVFWDCISWKALKLSNDDLRMLLSHAGSSTQFWMFHGSDPAVEEPDVVDQYFRLCRTERFSGRKVWSLSIYTPK